MLLRSVNSDALVQHLHTVVRQRVELGTDIRAIKKLSSLFIEILLAVLKESPPENVTATEHLNELSKGLVTLTETIVEHHWIQQQQGTAEDVIDARRTWHPSLKDAFRLTEADKALLEAEFVQHGWPPEGEERVKAELEKAVSSGDPVRSALLLSAGCLVDGRFKIVEFLADGFFKNGFVAVDLKNLQANGEMPKVFLATLKTSYECGIEEEAANEMRRLRTILNMQKHLAHPSLVKTLYVTGKNEPADVLVYATDRKFKIHCIVQELCEGGDLYSYLMTGSSGKPFSEPIARYFFSQLMEGVAVLHGRALYHMDIKIENVLVAKDRATGAYSIRLGDFGSMRTNFAGSQQDTKDVHLVQAKDLGVIPPELLKLQERKNRHGENRKYLGFDNSVKFIDAAKADIWSAGYLLLNLVAVQACMRHRLLFPAPRIDGKEGSRWTQLVAELKANPIVKNADEKWNWDILEKLQDKTVIVEERDAHDKVVRSYPIGNEALTASPELIDLLRSMLHSDPKKRPCASEVLRHPWLQWTHQWRPAEQVVINDMNSRRKPGTQADTQVYELPSTCTFGSASEVFALLERAVHGWKVELAPQELLLSIDLAGHIVVCRVLPHVEGQPWKIHCKWENGKISASWLGMYLDLKARLDYIVKSEPATQSG